MGVLAIRYVKASRIDPETRARENLPKEGFVKITFSNSEPKITYKAIDSKHNEVKENLKGCEPVRFEGNEFSFD
jgi:hypothetical protein